MEVDAVILRVAGWSENSARFIKQVRKEAVDTEAIHQKPN